jgi:hypothetical protein
MEKLELCIDKLTKYKFSTGPLIENIPQNELPKVPFGDFKKIDKNEIITEIVQKQKLQQQQSVSDQAQVSSGDKKKDRDAVVEKIAKDRLKIEKKKQSELRRVKKQLSKDASSNFIQNNTESSNEAAISNVKSGKTLSNISDEDDDFHLNETDTDDDENEDDEDDDDEDDDDLNPSKLSEYDDDKIEKESIISNITRHSNNLRLHNENKQSNSLSSSQISIELLNNNSDTSNSKDNNKKKTSTTQLQQSQPQLILRQNSEYENLSNKQQTNS